MSEPKKCMSCESVLEKSWTGDFHFCPNLRCSKSGDSGIVWKRTYSRLSLTSKRRDEDDTHDDEFESQGQ